jgi:MFS family permease
VFYGWWIAASAFLTLMLTVGIPFYGMPFFYDYFIREFGWSRAATTSGIAIATLLIQPAGGLLIHRFRPSRLIIFGSAMLCLSLALFGMGTGSLAVYYVAWCAFMAGYVSSGPIPHQVILSQWFRKRRGFVMGLAYLGLGLGGALSQKFVALPLINGFGWRTALMIIGALCLLVIPIARFAVQDRPSDKGLWPDGSAAAPQEFHNAPHSFGMLIRQRSFWLLAFGSFCSIGAIGSINQHMKLLFQDAGLTAATVADTTFYILVSSLIGRVAMGWLADVVAKKYVMIAAYLLVALPIPLLYVIDRPGAPLLFAIVFGFGLGADYMLIPLMAAHLFGPNSLARAMGVILPADSIGQTCFPFLLGLLYDSQGDYQTGLAVIAALALAGAIAIAMLPGTGVLRDDVREAEKCVN